MHQFIQEHIRYLRILTVMVLVSIPALLHLHISAPPAQAAGSIRCVQASGGATSAPCINKKAYTSIQLAIDAANDGDEIRIASGYYTFTFLNGYIITILNKSLTLRGGYTAPYWQSPTRVGTTIVDGQNRTTIISILGESTVTIEGLTIIRGNGGSTGGGITATLFGQRTLTLIDTTIANSTSVSSGGGLFSVGGTTILTRCQIVNNTAAQDGGGFFGYRLIAKDSFIGGNTASRYGGGIYASHVTIEHSQIVDNTAGQNGGGMYLTNSDSTLTMNRTQILNNKAVEYGGGLFFDTLAQGQIFWSLLANNQATDGEAIIIAFSDTTNLTLSNTTISQNSLSSHSAIRIFSTATLILNNTVITNYDVGIRSGTSPNLKGDYNAFANNNINELVGQNSVSLPFTHIITDNPQFEAPEMGNFHLRGTSPLRDAGNPSLSYTNQYDLDGLRVPVGSRVDIGAFEYILLSHHSYLPIATFSY